MPQQERVNLAVFIDFDNIEIGVKTTLGEHFDIGTILEALKERGEVVTKIAYADWTRAGEYSRALTQHAIRLVQRNLTPGGDKNGADINLALDALEMAFTHPHINAYVIVGGDSDFLSLVEKLKQYDKKVFVVGGRAFTSIILQRNCHEFIAYENLVRRPSTRGGKPVAAAQAAPIAQAFPLVRRALKILDDREVTPQTGLLKSTLLQLDSTFSERNYGATSFLDFAEKLSQAGLVQLKHAGRSVTVELNPGVADDAQDAVHAHRQGPGVDTDSAAARPADIAPRASEADTMPARQGDQADGVKAAARLLEGAPRWPMYVRNVKQILRAGSLDERAYGFGGLMDLLRACQRESLLRLERDRRGGLRVFQGQALARDGARVVPATPGGPAVDDAVGLQGLSEIMDMSELAAVSAGHDDVTAADGMDVDPMDVPPPSVVDRTAELLGLARPKRPRTRAAAPESTVSGSGEARGLRRSAPRKAASRRGTRSRKTGNE